MTCRDKWSPEWKNIKLNYKIYQKISNVIDLVSGMDPECDNFNNKGNEVNNRFSCYVWK